MSAPSRPAGKRLVLWRHGRTEWNATGRFQGHADVDLDLTGQEQARAAAARLAALRPDLVVASDLSRARDTAGPLCRLLDLPLRLDRDLRETDVGAWSGRTLGEVLAEDGATYAAWRAGDVDVRAGGAESRRALAHRVVAAVERVLSATPPDGLAVVVTHGGSARVAVATLIGLPPDHWHALGGLGNSAWSVLEQRRSSPGWVLVEHNAGTLPEPVTVQEG